MATDGSFSDGIPVAGNAVADDLPEILENFKFTKYMLYMISFFMMPGYYADYTYGSTYTDRVESISIKNASNTQVATCALAYDDAGGNNYRLTSEVWSFGTNTLTYNHTYTGEKITRSKLTTIA